MHILLAAAGSRGDVAPFTGLGTRLRAAGHQVAVATHTTFADSIRAAGLEFRPLPVDPRSELASTHGQRLLEAGGGPGVVLQVIRLGRRFMPALGDGIADATALGTDLLLTTSTTTALGQVAAEAAGIPSMGLFLQPLAPTREFAPAVTGTRSLGGPGNLLAGRAVQAAADQLFAPAVRALRRRLGLPPRRIAHARRNHPVLHGFSAAVIPRPADWHPNLDVAGYWWPPHEPQWQPPARLLDFLAAGPPPVFVGFGSLVVPDPERLTATVLTAVRAARVRAILQSGWSGLVAGDTDDVLTIGDVPHEWLFPRVAAVVHHAGAGTTAAALRSGTPAIPVPAQLDAPFWSARLASLGVSPGPVPLRGLTADRLATAIRQALDDPRYRDRAASVAATLAAEDGTAKVLGAIDRLVG
ncbi:glycosyltransferase family 1 protein [Streptomyces kaniharaensis]|uniref:Glycosyltransferase family 1 protein n=1 Tax=Streptomyces kaniharaensis TaxID=212423 RepID=A0A6N7KXR9_9ACTN|nr:glycosyltransferase [Streptomyces kaniharaensis]MQS15048.1 glycosyltransferase family 1 protein [Streptomyces kaniharaensis]